MEQNKVDVLAWIRNVPTDNGHKSQERANVAAAVVELIEAARQASEELYHSDDPYRFNQLRAAWGRLDDALANIGGAA